MAERISEQSVFSLLFKERGFIVQLVIQKRDTGSFPFEAFSHFSHMLLPHLHKAFELFPAIATTTGYSTGFE